MKLNIRNSTVTDQIVYSSWQRFKFDEISVGMFINQVCLAQFRNPFGNFFLIKKEILLMPLLLSLGFDCKNKLELH